MMNYLNSEQPTWFKNIQNGDVEKGGKRCRKPEKKKDKHESKSTEETSEVSKSVCEKCGNPLMHNDLCKTCDKRKMHKSYKKMKEHWLSKALEGQPGEYPYGGAPASSTIEELSGKTLKQLAILPRNEGEMDVVLRALEIVGLEGHAREQLQEAYSGRFNHAEV